MSGVNILFFDGVCNLCNRSVDFFMKHRQGREVYFASLQSELAKEILPQEFTSQDNLNTIIYFSEGKFYQKSKAVLLASKKLKGVYKYGSVLFVFPRFIRDAVYNLISRNRFKLFGQPTTCRLPKENEKEYFLETLEDLSRIQK